MSFFNLCSVCIRQEPQIEPRLEHTFGQLYTVKKCVFILKTLAGSVQFLFVVRRYSVRIAPDLQGIIFPDQ